MNDIKTETSYADTNVSVPKKKNIFKSFFRKLLLFVVVGFALYLAGAYLLASVFVYSKGDRIGYVYKFSNKGYIFKTNEGILKTGFVNLGNTTTPNEEWNFSVSDEKVANEITGIDQRIAVKLYYKEYYTRLFFKGDTKYFVYKMEKMPSQ
jgi:hypothetical protein